jgi:cell division protein FtsB
MKTTPTWRVTLLQLQEKCIVEEILTTTCAVALANCMRGIQSKRKLETLELSNNTVKRRIHDLSTDVEKQLVSRLKCSLLFHCHLTNQQTLRASNITYVRMLLVQ